MCVCVYVCSDLLSNSVFLEYSQNKAQMFYKSDTLMKTKVYAKEQLP